MKYTYSFVVIDEFGNTIVDRALTAEQAINILITQPEPAPIEALEDAEQEPDQKPEKKRGRPAKQTGPNVRKTGPGKGKRLCGNCSKPGHTFRTCQKRAEIAANASTDNDKLDEQQFDDLHDAMNDRDFSSRDYVEMTGLSLREVNKALMSATYQGYLDL